MKIAFLSTADIDGGFDFVRVLLIAKCGINDPKNIKAINRRINQRLANQKNGIE